MAVAIVWMVGVATLALVALLVASPSKIKDYCCRGIVFAEWLQFCQAERKERAARWAAIARRRREEVQYRILTDAERGEIEQAYLERAHMEGIEA